MRHSFAGHAGTGPGMLEAGMDINVPDRRNMEQKRIKKGQCPTCGIQTHKVNFLGQKKPLSIDNQVLYGQCLKCRPIEGYISRPQQQAQPGGAMQPREVPRTLEVGYDDDNSSLVSGITMDHRLIQGARDWDPSDGIPQDNYDSDDDFGRDLPMRRPEASLSGDDPYADGRPDPRGMPSRASYRGPRQPAHRESARPGGRRPNNLTSFAARQHAGHMDHKHYPSRPPAQSARGRHDEHGYLDGYNQSHFNPHAISSIRENGNIVSRHSTTSIPGPGPAIGGQRKVDADGYPVWQNPDDLLPPDGIDGLFRGRVGEPAVSSSNQHRPSPAVPPAPPSGEIQFHPAMHAEPPVYEPSPQSPPPSPGKPKSVSPHRPAARAPKSPIQDRGPSFHDDDEDNRNNKKPTATVSKERSYARHDSTRDVRDNRGIRASVMSNDSTLAPPLLNRDRRGLPDDDMIQDPMSMAPPPHPTTYEAASSQSPPRAAAGRSPSARGFGGVQTASPALRGATPRSAMPAEVGPTDRLAVAHAQPRQEPEVKATKQPAAKGAIAPPSEKVKAMYRRLSAEVPKGKVRKHKSQKYQDLPTILYCLHLEEANSKLRAKAFECLAEIVWKSGNKAKMLLAQYKGVDTLVSAMWADMADKEVQNAATQFLLSLAASIDGAADNDVLTNEEVVDTLTISMQTHITVESIQLRGCGILTCLATASGEHQNICDGTLSGALNMVLNVMQLHASSEKIQKAGIQALYAQCLLSKNAESNKRSVMENPDGISSLDVVTRAVERLQHDVVSLEWACKLIWCLTTREDLTKGLADSPAALRLVLLCYERYHQSLEASGLAEAAFGVIGNLAVFETSRTAIHDAGAVALILDGMRFHRNNVGVNVEGCAAVANLAFETHIRDGIVNAGGVDVLTRTLLHFSDRAEVVEEALRALVCLAIESNETKRILSTTEVLNSIARVSELHENSLGVQEMSSSLIASLAVGEFANHVIVESSGIEAVIRALGASSYDEVKTSAKNDAVEAACVAFRNLACQLHDVDPLMQRGASQKLVKVMDDNKESISIQMNGCCALWNLAFKTGRDPSTIIDRVGIQCIAKAIGRNIDSVDLVEMACGALWSLVANSVDRKEDVVASGGIDAVACACFVHPETPSILEKACGVFSSVSVEPPLAEAISQAQGLSIVVDAMRQNSGAIALLEIGSIVLRNLVIQFPHITDEASAALSTIIKAMKENPNAVALHRDACSVLWVMAANSPVCLSKINDLGALEVIMKTLEHHSSIPEVREAAFGVFHQITNYNQPC